MHYLQGTDVFIESVYAELKRAISQECVQQLSHADAERANHQRHTPVVNPRLPTVGPCVCPRQALLRRCAIRHRHKLRILKLVVVRIVGSRRVPLAGSPLLRLCGRTGSTETMSPRRDTKASPKTRARKVTHRNSAVPGPPPQNSAQAGTLHGHAGSGYRRPSDSRQSASAGRRRRSRTRRHPVYHRRSCRKQTTRLLSTVASHRGPAHPEFTRLNYESHKYGQEK